MNQLQEVAEMRVQGIEVALQELATLTDSARIVMDAIGTYLDAARVTAGIDPDTGELGCLAYPGMVHAAMLNHARAIGRYQTYAAALQAAKSLGNL